MVGAGEGAAGVNSTRLPKVRAMEAAAVAATRWNDTSLFMVFER
jgi:hypothetical protein